MNVRRYRAATMRAALEQARTELGAEALVLETREIRAGGFLGIGSRPMVELRVAANESLPSLPALATTTATKARKQSKHGQKKLDLTDNEQAWPLSLTGRQFSETTTQTARVEAEKNHDLTAEKKIQSSAETNQRRPGRMRIGVPTFARVTASTEAGTVSKREAESVSSIAAAQSSDNAVVSDVQTERTNARSDNEAKPAEQSDLVSRELAKLRAELRAEMRALNFSLGAFASQPVAHQSVTREAREAFEATPEIFDSPYYETYLLLTQTGMSPALARQAVRAAFIGGLSEVRDACTVARAGLAGALPALVRFADDALSAIPGAEGAPAASVFIGPTGVGKTTTIAKLAARVIYRQRRRVELITLDTWRIAAAEQLKTYAEIIGVGCHVAHSVEELNALIERMQRHAVILVDTAGRSPLDLSDGAELGEYLRYRHDLRKFLVLPATTHPTDAEAALAQFGVYGADRLVITKLDETARPGAAVGVAASAGLPLAWLSMGQRVPEDLDRATPLSFARSVVGIRN
jgi:flagellar biosynthesis protein FlhF